MDIQYIEKRDKSFINRYKLNRRAREICRAIKKARPGEPLSLLDIGSADGILLSFLTKNIRTTRAIGIEPSFECIKARPTAGLAILNSVAEAMPFKDESFDIIVAASVIDHLQGVGSFLDESRRILKKNGLLIITAIVPFYDKLANISGLDKGLHPHVKTFSTVEIANTLKAHDFSVVSAKRFALPSFGLMPMEKKIESLLNMLFLDRFMFYSFVMGKRNG